MLSGPRTSQAYLVTPFLLGCQEQSQRVVFISLRLVCGRTQAEGKRKAAYRIMLELLVLVSKLGTCWGSLNPDFPVERSTASDITNFAFCLWKFSLSF